MDSSGEQRGNEYLCHFPRGRQLWVQRKWIEKQPNGNIALANRIAHKKILNRE
jgi:hypothetical protein